MPLYFPDSSNHNSFYFIHIPRTGGRFFHNLMKMNHVHSKYDSFLLTYLGKEVPHLEYPLYNDLDGVLESKKFAIVRNPIDRFTSCVKGFLNYYNLDVNFFNRDFTEKEFTSFITQEVEHYQNPFMFHQHKFVDENTLVWKLEDGLGTDSFIQWFNSNFNLNIEMKENITYDKHNYDHIEPQISSSVYSFAKKYYEKDYEFFNYSIK